MQSVDKSLPTKQKKPRGYELLSQEYKDMWDAIAREHPWFNHDTSKSDI